jgi:hypothetical protein
MVSLSACTHISKPAAISNTTLNNMAVKREQDITLTCFGLQPCGDLQRPALSCEQRWRHATQSLTDASGA